MELLAALLVLFALTRLFGRGAERVGQPSVVGELSAGVLIGVLVTQWPDTLSMFGDLPDDDVFQILVQLGLFFLMLDAGIEMDHRKIRASLEDASIIAVGGMLLPLAAGFAAAWLLLPDADRRFELSLFVGTALAITAVPVSVRALSDLGQLDTRLGRVVVSAALVDDVLSLGLLAVLVGLVEEGSVSTLDLGLLVAKAAIFFAVTAFVGIFIYPIGRFVRPFWSEPWDLGAIVLVGLGFAAFAELLDLHFILGAFMAGLFFSHPPVAETAHRHVEKGVAVISGAFLAPFFFASVGLRAELSAITAVPAFVVLLIAIAVAGKVVGAGLSARLHGFGAADSWAIGAAMSGRGAVELVIADIALRGGLFEESGSDIIDSLYSGVVIMAIVTTLFAPLALRWILAQRTSPG